MLIVQFALGIAICVVFCLMIYSRIQALKLLSISTTKKLIIVIFWFIPISERNRSEAAIAIRKANKLLYLFIVLFLLWFIIAQFS